jgi:exopolysaccharide biosynthesis predicted pyruvyltransferase EpsI
MTLLLPKYSGPRKGKLLVDVNNNINYIPDVDMNGFDTSNYKVITNELIDLTKKYDFVYRMAETKKLLEMFKQSELVITTRLHCALPCRAFGTPVKFIHKDYYSDNRFTGLKHILCGSDKLSECKDTFDTDKAKKIVSLFGEVLI